VILPERSSTRLWSSRQCPLPRYVRVRVRVRVRFRVRVKVKIRVRVSTRAILHEAMEQQTVSINKVRNVTLPPSFSIAQNLTVSPNLLL
jgi:hypothetical protein